MLIFDEFSACSVPCIHRDKSAGSTPASSTDIHLLHKVDSMNFKKNKKMKFNFIINLIELISSYFIINIVLDNSIILYKNFILLLGIFIFTKSSLCLASFLLKKVRLEYREMNNLSIKEKYVVVCMLILLTVISLISAFILISYWQIGEGNMVLRNICFTLFFGCSFAFILIILRLCLPIFKYLYKCN